MQLIRKKLGDMMAEEVTVGYACTGRYYSYLMVAIKSLVENNKSHIITIYVFSEDMTTEMISTMKEEYESKTVSINYIVPEDKLFGTIFARETFDFVFPRITHVPLFINKLLPKDCNRILMLEADTLVLEDISELFKIDMGTNVFGGCLGGYSINYYHNTSGIYDDSIVLNRSDIRLKRFNGGVVLINVDQMRKENRDADYYKQYRVDRNKTGEEYMMDSCINKGHGLFLNPKYNYRVGAFYNYAEKQLKPHILHYVNSEDNIIYRKPWQVKFKDNEPYYVYPNTTHSAIMNRSLKEANNLWWSYAEKTVVYDQLLDEALKERENFIINLLPRLNKYYKLLDTRNEHEVIFSLEGHYGKYDPQYALMYLEKIVSNNPTSINKYIEILIRNDIDFSVKVIDVLLSLYKEYINSETYNKISHIYLDNKLVPKDLNKALVYARRAYELNSKHVIELFDLLYCVNTKDANTEMAKLIKEVANSDNPDACGRLAKLYREGRGVTKDLDLAAKWMKEAADFGVDWAKIEYYEILLEINTPESLEKMIQYGVSEAKLGNNEITARLARAYRDGKGVETDLKRAADLMEATIYSTPRWARWEYIDIMWNINTPETDKRMYTYAEHMSKTGIREIDYRLAHMYRDGRGTKKNLSKAAEHMRKAASKKTPLANYELIDILYEMGSKESLTEMIGLLNPMVDSGDGEAIGRLARAYRDGKGVKKNINKSIELMELAVAKKNRWIIPELNQLKNDTDLS